MIVPLAFSIHATERVLVPHKSVRSAIECSDFHLVPETVAV